MQTLNKDTQTILEYFENKINGYKSGELQKTFNINKEVEENY
jgi:hypothetical protein